MDPVNKTLQGFESIHYTNNSPDTLQFIWFHLWPNAYKNDKTAFSEQLLKLGRTDFYFSDEAERGYINRLDFTVDGKEATVTDHPAHQDIVKLWLPSPLAPGGSIEIKTPFHVKLPKYFSRSGYAGGLISVTQWFPKPAVYDRQGWHEMPYLDQGEFYSEFGNYDVKITAPASYTVAATGNLTDSIIGDSLITWHYRENNIHDFAFFAGNNLVTAIDTMNLHDRIIRVYSYYQKNDPLWAKSIDMIKRAVIAKSSWIGEYPFNTVKAVQNPKASDGGMEYPTITLIGPADSYKELESVIHHEVGHNWFYGILASNERKYPWMDEGMNTYYDKRFEQSSSADPETDRKSGNFFTNRIPDDMEGLILSVLTEERMDQPIGSESADFTGINYGLIAYYKTGMWMKLLENQVGKETFDRAMKDYFKDWKFRHPGPDDFRKTIEKTSGKNLDSLFALIQTKGPLDHPEKKGLKVMGLLSLKDTRKHHFLFLSPSLGYNSYDKFMAGIMIHNYTLPLPRFRYFMVPMYATGSKTIRGLGGLSYSFFPGNSNSQITAGINVASFSKDSYRDSSGKENHLYFRKLVPYLRYDFRQTGSVTRSLEWKTYLFAERNLLFTRDTGSQSYKIDYPVDNSYINRLSYTKRDCRVLYPYEFTLLGEQGKQFMKWSFTWNGFFNYGDRKKGGLQARFFAGKFFYLGSQNPLSKYQTSRYQLNLTGPNGFEDYTYSDYFAGRNEFEGMASRQIMRRDGFFKIRTDLLSNKIGKTDDWLAAINLSSSIPDKINPLSVLPFKIPLRAFLDIGTFAGAWKSDATSGKLVYDAGLELSLADNTIHVFVPLLMSKVFRDYVKSTIPENRFWKTISFTIELNNLSPIGLLRKSLQ